VLCDRAIVLDGGRVVEEGSPEDAVNVYNHIMARQSEEEEGRHLKRQAGVYGTHDVVVDHAELTGQRSQASMLTSGEVCDLQITIRANKACSNVSLGILIRDRFGQDIFGINTHERHSGVALEEGEARAFHFTITAAIAPGKYTVSIALHPGDQHLEECYWWQDGALSFEVAGFSGPVFSGVCELPHHIHSASPARQEIS
jgi:lipopolysaccharide transport system ATP-binding protein